MSDFEAALARVNWANLEHAYGPATDVPDMLRTLKNEGLEPLNIKGGTIMHQGTRYSVTPHVIPCLAAMLTEEKVANRADIVECLLWFSAWEVEYEECGGKQLPAPMFEDEYTLCLACYQAGRARLPLLLEIAATSDERARATACNGLFLFRTEYDRLLPFATQRYAVEESELVRTALAMAQANMLHEHPPFEPVMREIHASDPSLVVRATAAAMLAFCDMHDDEVVSTLKTAVDDEECMALAESLPAIEWHHDSEIRRQYHRVRG